MESFLTLNLLNRFRVTDELIDSKILIKKMARYGILYVLDFIAGCNFVGNLRIMNCLGDENGGMLNNGKLV